MFGVLSVSLCTPETDDTPTDSSSTDDNGGGGTAAAARRRRRTSSAEAEVEDLGGLGVAQVDRVLVVEARGQPGRRGIQHVGSEEEGERRVAGVSGGCEVEVELEARREEAAGTGCVDTGAEGLSDLVAVELGDVQPVWCRRKGGRERERERERER